MAAARPVILVHGGRRMPLPVAIVGRRTLHLLDRDTSPRDAGTGHRLGREGTLAPERAPLDAPTPSAPLSPTFDRSGAPRPRMEGPAEVSTAAVLRRCEARYDVAFGCVGFPAAPADGTRRSTGRSTRGHGRAGRRRWSCATWLRLPSPSRMACNFDDRMIAGSGFEMRNRMKSVPTNVTAIVAASCLLAACSLISPAADGPPLEGTGWILSSLPGQALVPAGTVTLRFESGRVQGSDGCNRYTAPYNETGSLLEVSPKGASTQMACPPAVMAQADGFMAALTRTRAWRIAAGQLELLTADGLVLATLVAQSEALAGTAWRVTGYNNGRQAVVSVLAGTTLTMAFSADGKVSGSAGCNRYTAPYKAEGRKLALGPVAATRMDCARPERAMEQEQRFLKALETVATARFEGDRLELRTAEGALAVSATREAGR
jgi:heat shock protein HslJ